MYGTRRYLLGAFALVAVVASESCSLEDGECSSLPTSVQAAALLQVERQTNHHSHQQHKKEKDARSHHHHHHPPPKPHENTATTTTTTTKEPRKVHKSIKDAPSLEDPEQKTAGKINAKLLDTTLAREKSSVGFARLAFRAAADGFCTGHPCHASLLGNGPAQKGHLGTSAALTQAGYEKVAAMKDDMEMKSFILRLVDKYDCKVEDSGGIMGIVPWFSGTTLVQDIEKLENTLLYAVLADPRKGTWLSYKNSDHITGDSAGLDFVGYVQVAATKSDEEMKKYVRKICRNIGVKVVDEGGFTGMVKYYSGTDNFQSFERLQQEVRSAANAPHSWAEWEKPQNVTSSKASMPSAGFSMLALALQSATGFSRLALRAQRGFCKDFPCRVTFRADPNGDVNSAALLQQGGDSNPASDRHGLGKRAALDQDGYSQVAALKNDAEMKEFIVRVIDKYDCKVENEAGLIGIVPWFSGATAVQNLEKLENTVLYAVLTFTHNPWITFRNTAHMSGDTADLNFVGYVQVAAMKDDTQMQKFAKRVCDSVGVNIVKQDGFAGMVRYYSGTDNFQSYDRLLSEIKSASNSPNSWASAAANPAMLMATSVSKESVAAPSTESGGVGDTVELNFAGYVRVSTSRSEGEMKKFARRTCQMMGVKIVDEGGFQGVVKFYVGPDNFQSYDKLQSEIRMAASKANSWCRFT